MPDKYLYLLLDLGAISIPLAFSFYSKAPFLKTYKKIIPALLIPMIGFIIWDILFTREGIWGFNENYLLGITILGLPIEEWLFFLAIPYACLFTYFALKHLLTIRLTRFNKIGWVLGMLALVLGLINYDKAYTLTTFSFLGVLFFFLTATKAEFIAQFLLSYVFILIPFFIINGILTGSCIVDEVVWYNDMEILGIRMWTIPIEDAFYGMLLLLLNVTIWERI